MIRSFQWDLARQVERLDWLLAQLPRYAEWGYQELHVHLEDAVEFPSLPGVARGDAYTYKQFGRLVDAATRVGIKVVPIVNLLGHTQYLIKVPELRDLNELRADDGSPLDRGQICPLHPRTLEIAEKLLRDMAPFCTAGKVHVGLDESFHLGKHPLSRAEIGEIGLAAHFAGHVSRLHALTTSLHLRMGFWADMLCFIPEAIPLLPRGLIAYDWYYYPFPKHPRVELFNYLDYDLATPLQAHGIEYWGCPMNGAFRFETLPLFGDRLANIESWWKRSKRVDAEGVLISSWEPYRLAMEMTTAVDAAAASFWLNPEVSDPATRLALGFARAFNLTPNAARREAAAALACDRHGFTGYARWETHDRWTAVSARDPLNAYAAGERFYRKVAGASSVTPFAASAVLLRYLYARDIFLRRAARGVVALRRRADQRRALARMVAQLHKESVVLEQRRKEAVNAARTIWRRSRAASHPNPNEQILRQDRVRLNAWAAWLKSCEARPENSFTASPVMGTWQLTFTVHNFAPAVQKVVVEQRMPDGTWRDLVGRFTIEFSATAAARHSSVTREFSVPVEPGPMEVLPELRVAIRGIGRVRVSAFQLTNGLAVLQASGPARAQAALGRTAPAAGWPKFDVSSNADVLPLSFGQ